MKELNIIEASNMPVGTEFKMIRKGVEMPNRVYIDNDSRCLKWVLGNESVHPYKDNLNAKFILIQKPVSFDYAINKGLEGKRIKVNVTKLNEEYSDEYTCVLNNAWNNVYYSIERIFEMLSKATYCKEIIKEGEWYVEG